MRPENVNRQRLKTIKLYIKIDKKIVNETLETQETISDQNHQPNN